MKLKKYRKAGTVIFGIFIFAVLCVAAAAIIIYQNGLRYIKSDAGIKYFGNVDLKTDSIVDGRLWFENSAADITLQKLYIVEAKDREIAARLPDYSMFQNISGEQLDNILGEINYLIPGDFTDHFPMNNFVFNATDDRILFRNETFEVLIKNYENTGNHIINGAVWVREGTDIVLWVLNPVKTNPSSFRDFEVVRDNNRERKYRGDIIEFMKKEPVFYASFELKNGSIIRTYLAHDSIYRISFDKGPNSGDLYIGKINGDFEKHGRGLYIYGNSGDIYLGDFQNGAKTGHGEFLSDSGDSYTGQMLGGRKHGEGIFRWSDGASYAGMFYDNMKNGSGKNIFADGSVYEGDYILGVKHGRGRYVWANGDVYEGDFVDDLYEGFGRYIWASGDFYEGEFKYNTLHGEGIYVWVTGRTYRGVFSHGRMLEERPE